MQVRYESPVLAGTNPVLLNSTATPYRCFLCGIVPVQIRLVRSCGREWKPVQAPFEVAAWVGGERDRFGSIYGAATERSPPVNTLFYLPR
jgi:hypothetical protein